MNCDDLETILYIDFNELENFGIYIYKYCFGIL